MFWSHDLLGKKTALGAVWIAAHGKKLNKGRILQVNVSEACKKVMDPEVPQALRLQAILVGGIVIVHAKQQFYLLEDTQEMLRRLRALSSEGDAAKVTLDEEKKAAREEAITLPLGAGDMQLLNLGDLFPTFASTQLGPALSEGGGGFDQQQVSDGLFVMPTLPDGPTQELQAASGGGGAAATARQRNGKGRRGAATDREAAAAAAAGGGGSGLLLAAAAGEGGDVELNLEGLPRHDLELMDGPETFAVPDMDLPGMDFFNLGGGMAMGGMDAGGMDMGGMDMPPLPDDLLPVPSGLAGEQPPPSVQQLHREQEQAPSSQTPQTSAERSDGSKGAAPRGGSARSRAQRGGGGRRRVKATVDDIDTLQIRGRDYREWMNDRTDLLVPRPQRSAPTGDAATITGAAAAASKAGAIAVGPATAASLPGGAWPPELQALFMRNATLPSAGAASARPRKGKRGGPAGEEAEAEQERRQQLDDELAGGPPLPMDDGGFGFGFGYGMDGGYPELLLEQAGAEGEGEQAGAAGNPFAGRHYQQQQQLSMESDGEFDVETERLRAALNSTQGFGSEPFHLQQLGLTPASADPRLPGGGSALATGRGGGANTRAGKRGSSVLRRDSETTGVASEKSSERRDGQRLSDLLEDGRLGLGLGLGPAGGEDLGAMLPAVGEDEPFLEEEEEEGEGEGGSHKRRRTGDGGSDGFATGTGPTQFELLEASGPTQALPMAAAAAVGDALNKQTLAFISVLRGRFHAAESQLAAEGADVEGCQLSFFDMAARLSRMDAAKLFYQVLVTRSHGFLTTYQEEPYGDILLSRGAYL